MDEKVTIVDLGGVNVTVTAYREGEKFTRAARVPKRGGSITVDPDTGVASATDAPPAPQPEED